MRIARKRLIGGAVVTGGVVLLRPGTRANRLAYENLEKVANGLRHLSGVLQGLVYRLRGGRPDPDVADNILADRIRSSLGGLEKRLDIPHVHVMVEDHVALLHGEVDSAEHAKKLEAAVARVSGVEAVSSHLHVGLGKGDTRPSTGRHERPQPGG